MHLVLAERAHEGSGPRRAARLQPGAGREYPCDLARSGNPVYPIGLGEADAVWIETAQEYESFFPTLARMNVEGPRARAFWCVPLVAEGRAIGMIGVGFHEERHFSADEREFVGTFARQCAQALARARRLEASARQRRLAETAKRVARRRRCAASATP